jgi:hypothetical protein
MEASSLYYCGYLSSSLWNILYDINRCIVRQLLTANQFSGSLRLLIGGGGLF